MTISVCSTATPSWPGGGRQAVLVVSGDLYGWEWPKIAGAIAEAEATGVALIVLDIRAVRSCDREALFELVAVRGRWPTPEGCPVDVVGVRAAQFLDAMAHEPITQLHDLQVVIGELRRPRVSPPTTVSESEQPRDGGDPSWGGTAEERARGRGTSAPAASRGSGRSPVQGRASADLHLLRGRHRE
ncbi:hypothetical protein [Actinomycetospora straminea]|uniref:STAS domain-containing protein n=1 Tax=Actinomycetospora straminea TaxID=663607 RepID=A0ABP9ERM5_9PSEU|nr:hypothetical protein [Actinomycetospora straminea]MDD7935473.1 hypothetical protein [Actinomycetospora straminea]